jgi:hypothetical protein
MLTMKPNTELRWMVVCAALIVIVASLAACQPPTIISSDDLVGIWTSDYGGFTEYREDGTHRHSDSIEGLETLVGMEGQYQLQGTRLTLQTAEDSVYCSGIEGSYQVQMTKDGELEYELEADECAVRRVGITTGGPLHRVSP